MPGSIFRGEWESYPPSYGSTERQSNFAEVNRITNVSQPAAPDENELELNRPLLLRWVPVFNAKLLFLALLTLTFVQLSKKAQHEALDEIHWDICTIATFGGLLAWVVVMFATTAASFSTCNCCCGTICIAVWLTLGYYALVHGGAGKYIKVFCESIGPALAWTPNLLIAAWKTLMNEAGVSKHLPPTYSDWRIAAYGGFMYLSWLSYLVFGQQIALWRTCGPCLGLVAYTPSFLLIGGLYTNRLVGELVKSLWQIALDLRKDRGSLEVVDWATLVLLSWWLLLPYPTFEQLDMCKMAERHERLFNEGLEEPYYATFEPASTQRIFRALSGRFSPADNEDLEAGPCLQRSVSETNTKRDVLVKEAREYHLKSAEPLSMDVNICRTKILEESLKTIGEAAPQQLALSSMGYFKVRFKGEAGIDMGGLRRDWFESVAQALLRGTEDVKGTSLLTLAPDKTLMPRSCLSGLPGATKLRELQAKHDPEEKELRQRLKDLMHAGRFVALAVVHAQPIPICLGTFILKCLLKIPIHVTDVRQLDPEFYRNRVQLVLKAGGVNEVNQALGEPLTFMSAPTEAAPEPTALVEFGETTLVTEENKQEYAMLLCEAYLCGSIRTEMQMFLRGFWEVLPHLVLAKSGLSYRELAIFIAGLQEIDVAQWRRHTEFHSPNALLISWLFEVLGELTNDQRSMFLQFATGSSRVPPGGFGALQPVFKVVCVDEPGENLPHSHTCFNQLMLPMYSSKQQLKNKVLTVIAFDGDMGFGFG